jgi:hypothetical protein
MRSSTKMDFSNIWVVNSNATSRIVTRLGNRHRGSNEVRIQRARGRFRARRRGLLVHTGM